eukprot:60250_1
MLSLCRTDALLPTWITVVFVSCSFILLCAVAIYCFVSLKRAPSKSDQATLDWNSLSCSKKTKMWAKDVWAKKSMYLPYFTHLTDTATDYAAIVEFYYIARSSTPAECGGLDMWKLFGLSIGCMIMYRIISSITIWRITKSTKRVLLQLIDFELFEILYISHYLNLNGTSSPQRLISTLEAVFEAAPQSLIQMIYLMNTGNFEGVIFFSSILSFITLTKSVINDDKIFLKVQFSLPWKHNDSHLLYRHKGKWKFQKFVLLHLVRILDIPSQILLYIFLWFLINGYALTVVLCLDAILALICFAKTKNTDALLTVIATPTTFGSWDFSTLIYGFWGYSILKNIGVVVSLWIVALDDTNNIFNTQSSFVIALFLFSCIAALIKWFPFFVLVFTYKNDNYPMARTKERSNVDRLVGSNFNDAMELIFYKNQSIKTNNQRLYGVHHKHSLLSIACRLDNTQLFNRILAVGLDIFDDKEDYYTALMAAIENNKSEYVKSILNHSEINYNYLMKKIQSVSAAALPFIVLKADHELLVLFLDCVERILQNDDDKDAKKIALLKNSYNPLLPIICEIQLGLDKFTTIYEFYPTLDSKKEAVMEKSIGNDSILRICSRYHLDDIKAFVLLRHPEMNTETN